MSRGESPQSSAREGVFYVNRATGALEEETVYGRGFMEFFYDTAPGRLLTNGLFSKPWFSRLYGLYNDSALSRRKIPKFVASLNLDWAEVAGEPGDFRSFNEFFARSLKPSARPLDPDPRVLISPADARIYVFPKINETTLLPVKGAAIPVAELLADSAAAASYVGGGAVILRLCPADYHRFHFPASGQASPWRSIPGSLHSVSPFALEKGIDVFCRNHRVAMELDSDEFGRIALVDVGALGVGAIIEVYSPGRVERGAERGYFKFGGSSIVMLTMADRVRFDEDLVRNTESGRETLVRFGERLGVAQAQDAT